MTQPHVTLYQAEWCQYSAMVRRKLAQLGINYELVEVPMDRHERTELELATMQRGIPAMLVDGQAYVDMPMIMSTIGKLGVQAEAA